MNVLEQCLISPKEPGCTKNPYEHDTPPGSVVLLRYKIHVLTVQVLTLTTLICLSHCAIRNHFHSSAGEDSPRYPDGTHPAQHSHQQHFILSALGFSHLLNNSRKPLEMRHVIMPPWSVRMKCNDFKLMRQNTYTLHTPDTLLYFRAKKPRRATLNLCFCLWPAYKAWYTHRA